MNTEEKILFMDSSGAAAVSTTLQDVIDALNITGALNVQIADTGASYITPMGSPNEDIVDLWLDQTGNDNHYYNGVNPGPTIVENNADINNKMACYWTPSSNDQMIIDSSINANFAADYNFLVNNASGGASIVIMLKMADVPGPQTLSYIFSTFSGGETSTGSVDGIAFRAAHADDSFRIFHGRGGTGSGDWYISNTNNNDLIGNFAQDVWYFLIFRTNYSNLWEFQNGLGDNWLRTSFDLTVDTTGDLDGTVQLGSTSATRKFTGYMTLNAIYDRYLTDAQLQAILDEVNGYYSTSFVLA